MEKVMKKIKKKSKIEALDIVILVFILLFAGACLFPFINILFTSFSTEVDYYNATIMVIPEHFTLEAYRYIFLEGGMLRSFFISLFVTVVGGLYNMVLTTIGAYALSKSDLPGRKILFTMILITMFFGGGIIPLFLVIKDLGMYNKFAGIIIPFGINTFNMILLRNFFADIPKELIETAQLDGANELTILTKVILPSSLAGLATIALFYFVERFNDWYMPMLLLQNEEMFPLSLKLRYILSDMQSADYYTSIGVDSTKLYSKGQDAASVIISIIPILCVYPFVQKHFVKGVMLGSVKG